MAEAKQKIRNPGALNNIGANKPLVPFIKNAEVKSYDPSMSDKIAYWMAENLGSGDRQSVRRAKKFTEAGQFVSDYGSLRFYFRPYAPVVAGFDISRGLVYNDPYEVALGTIGIARPFKKVAQTISDEAERALTAATGTGAASMSAMDFIKSLLSDDDEKDEE